MSNKPPSWELFLLQDGQQKITMTMDTKIPNAATFTIQKEDHTLANLIRMQIMKNPNVVFVGYKIPHPLEHYFVLKIQTTLETTPKDVFSAELEKIIKTVEDISKKFKFEVNLQSENMEHDPEIISEILFDKVKFIKRETSDEDIVAQQAKLIANGEASIGVTNESTVRNELFVCDANPLLYRFPKDPFTMVTKQGKNVTAKDKTYLLLNTLIKTPPFEKVSELTKKLEKYENAPDYKKSYVHSKFIKDCIKLYNHPVKPMQGISSSDLVNGFTPHTWHRLSKLQKGKKNALSLEFKDKSTHSSPLILPKIFNPRKRFQQRTPKNNIESDSLKNKDLENTCELPNGLELLNLNFQKNYTRVFDILKVNHATSGTQRSPLELKILTSCLSNHGAFSKLTNSVFKQIANVIKLETFSFNETLFNQGDSGTCYYIILLGYVRVTITKIIQGITKQITIAVLEPGEGLGEQAILSDAVRNATAIAASNKTFLARIDKADYKRTMAFIRWIEKKEKIYFLRIVKILKCMDTGQLNTLADKVMLRTFEKNSVIVKEGEKLESVYFIRSGNASVFRNVQVENRMKKLLVGRLTKGDTIHDELLLNKANYTGSLTTVVADDELQLGVITASKWGLDDASGIQ